MNKNWNESLVASTILKKKYFHEGETFDDFINRVSGIFSTGLQEQVRNALLNADFFPAGRSLHGAGAKGKFKASMSNCYVLGKIPDDTIESIYDTNKQMARIFSYGGGVGINISTLRPKDAKVHNSARTSSGAVSFLELFNATGDVIGQHGRRGAMMIGLDCTHPDIEEFLRIKQTNHKLESANLSILFTDEFMEAVKNRKSFTLTFDVESTGEHIEKTIDAYEFFMEFCRTQWDWGDPGAIFIDSVRKNNLLSGYPEYEIDISNPCSEFMANAGNSCNLGSINLYNMVDDAFTSKAKINRNKLEQTVRIAVRALDEILDYGYESQPLDNNRKCIDDWRSIGLGVFGLADMLVALGVEYGSDKSLELIEDLMFDIFQTALDQSCELAREKGTFGKYDWNKTKESPLISCFAGINLYDKIKKYGLRNGTILSIAPTGSLSLLCGETGGCEPLFKIGYERTTHALENNDKTFKVYAKSAEELLKHHNLSDLSDNEIKQRFPFVVESHDIDPINRVRVQEAMQTWVDNAISSTVNLKSTATPEDIYDIYMEAWRLQLKGITVFRDGCKRGNILGVAEVKNDSTPIYNHIKPHKRRNILKVNGSTIKKSTACADSMYITVNKSESGDIFEVFNNSSGGCTSNLGTITRLVSLALRSGVCVDSIIGELKENKCQGCLALRKQGKQVSQSCGNALAEAIEEMYGEKKDNTPYMICPECGEQKMRAVGKCTECVNCGYSKCE